MTKAWLIGASLAACLGAEAIAAPPPYMCVARGGTPPHTISANGNSESAARKAALAVCKQKYRTTCTIISCHKWGG